MSPAEVASNTRSGSRAGQQPVHATRGRLQRRAAGPGPGRRMPGPPPPCTRTSTCSLRCSLASRSVPMLPGPTIAAVALLISSSVPANRAVTLPSPRTRGHGVTRADRDGGGDRAGQDHLPASRPRPGPDRVRQPRQGGERRAEHRAARAGAGQLAVLVQGAAREPQVHGAGRDRAAAQHHAARTRRCRRWCRPARSSSPGSASRSAPERAARSHRGDRLGDRHAGAAQRPARTKAISGSTRGCRNGTPGSARLRPEHAVQQVAVVGLVHAQLPLHRGRGQADLVPLICAPPSSQRRTWSNWIS